MKPSGALVLKDIHLPAPPSWWPPAYGWWMLAAAVLLLASGLAWMRRRSRPRRRRWRQASDELRALATPALGGAAVAAGISQLMRRAVRVRDPAAATATGQAWTLQVRDLAPSPDVAARLLAVQDALYVPGAEIDAAASLDAARSWLRHVLLERRR